MHAMLQSQPPQEVLNYYVHGNPFVHRDASPAEYTLGDMRTAYATRLAVNNQYQVSVPSVRACPSSMLTSRSVINPSPSLISQCNPIIRICPSIITTTLRLLSRRIRLRFTPSIMGFLQGPR
jgi:hypothetical protein